MAMVQLPLDNIPERAQRLIIDNKPVLIQRFRLQYDFSDIIMPVQTAALMRVRQSLNDMAGTEMKLLADKKHDDRYGLPDTGGPTPDQNHFATGSA